MGTRAHVVVTADPGLEDQLTELAARELSLMERRWSRFLPTSELSRLNAAAGKPVIVSADTFSVIKSAVDAWKYTDGCFDPTVHDALCATGYDRTFAELAERPDRPGTAPPTPGCAEIELDPALCAVRLPVGVRLDLGGIAKGAAADLVVGRLRANGADGACVNVGGDIRVDGRAPTTDGMDHRTRLRRASPSTRSLSRRARCARRRVRNVAGSPPTANATTSSIHAAVARRPGCDGSA